MKILIVSNGYPPGSYGGVEVYSYDLARELQRRGHQVQIFHRVSDPSAPDYSQISTNDGGITLTVVVNDYKKSTSFRDLYEDAAVHQIFSSVLDGFRPDFVHFNHLLALSVTLPGETARRGIPNLIMLHDYWSVCQRVNLVDRWQRICTGPRQGGDCPTCVFGEPGVSGGLVQLAKKLLPFRLRGKLRKFIRPAGDATVHFRQDEHAFEDRERAFRDALYRTNKVLVPSQFVHDLLAANGMDADGIEVLPLGVGVEPSQARRHTDGLVRFGYAGSVAPLKGLETLLHAFRNVNLRSIRLDVHGREDLHPEFARGLREIAAGDERITFHGPFVPDQRGSMYAQMDVFVMPSVWHETFSLVAREALRCGVPVIAAQVGALPEVVREGMNGFLYSPGDAAALAKIIRRIGEQPNCLAELDVPGSVEILSVPEHVARIEAVYQQILEAEKQ